MEHHFLDSFNPAELKLIIDRNPYPQSQGCDWKLENTVHDDYDLFFCYGGLAEFSIDKTVYLLKPGCALLIPPHTPFSAEHRGRSNFDAVAQHFRFTAGDNLDFFSLIEYQPLVKLYYADEIKILFRRYTDYFLQGRKKIIQHSLFRYILTCFIYDSFIKQKVDLPAESLHNTGKHSFIIEMIKTIDAKLFGSETLKHAYALSPYNIQHTNNLFKRVVQDTPRHYLIRKRIEHSKIFLCRGMSVREAALAAGFNDEFYFSRVFKKLEKISPSAYRCLNQSCKASGNKDVVSDRS